MTPRCGPPAADRRARSGAVLVGEASPAPRRDLRPRWSSGRASTCSSSVGASVALVGGGEVGGVELGVLVLVGVGRASTRARPTGLRSATSATGTGSSHGWSSSVEERRGVLAAPDRRAASPPAAPGRRRLRARSAASLSSRWRSASGSSAAVGPGPPASAPLLVTTHLVPEQPHHRARGASGGTAKDVSASRIVLSGGRPRWRRSGLRRPSRGASAGRGGEAQRRHHLGAAGHGLVVVVRAVRTAAETSRSP